MNVIEIFHSIQGESTLAGIPTTFVRFARCNLRCVWCDTPYSFGAGTPMSHGDIMAEIKKAGLQHICLTGGEPLLQTDLPEFCTKLLAEGYVVSVETGGHMDISILPDGVKRICDIKTPGAFGRPSTIEESQLFGNTEFHEENINHFSVADEVKFVVASLDELPWIQAVMDSYSLAERVGAIHISPVHGVVDLEALARFLVDEQLPARLHLQMHKFVFGDTATGV